MKIVVVGATGNVGSRLVVQAAAAGHDVVAYARRPEAVPVASGVTVLAGLIPALNATRVTPLEALRPAAAEA